MSSTVETILLYTIAAGLLSIVYGFFTGKNILNSNAGNKKMQEIASAIQIGAKAYLARQYKTIAIVGVVVLVIVSIAFSPLVGVGYLIGAALSGIAGYVGMLVSVEANVRTAEASRKGLAQGLSVAFKSGAVTGMLVAGLALLSIAVYYYLLLKLNVDEREIVNALVALGFGASLISIFARLGGGIFTKGADVGADLVGKVEAGIPEDDPRNPAVIADNVGDNVGDCAGMAADLFETYAVTIVATMVLSSIFFVGDLNMMIYPLSIGAACLLTSILGTFFVKLGNTKNVMNALYKGFVVSAVASLVILWPVTDHVIGFTNELVSRPSFYIDETKITGTSLENNVDAYLGIPFAQPPVNDLRWEKTQSKIFKQTEFYATDFAPACMQGPRIVNWYRGVAVGFGGDPNYIDLPDISEDCLYLNMWVPNNLKNIDTKLPVLVYIHGGSNRAGWSFEPNYIGEKLAQKGTIVISVAYRLGVFGFLT